MKIIFNESKLIFRNQADLSIDTSALSWVQGGYDGAGNFVNSQKMISTQLDIKKATGIIVSYNSETYTLTYSIQNYGGASLGKIEVSNAIQPLDAQMSSTKLEIKKTDGSAITPDEIGDVNLKMSYVGIEPYTFLCTINENKFINLSLKKGKTYQFEKSDAAAILWLDTESFYTSGKKTIFEAGSALTSTVTLDSDYNSALAYFPVRITANKIIKIKEVQP